MSLSIVSAGAGAGKTYHIAKTLTGWVREGAVRPERVLAVTFTEAAASELQGRLRTALLEDGQPEAAMALGQAYVSTIHALGARLVTEHALACGLAPGTRLIDDAEAELLRRRAVAEAEALLPIVGELTTFGYRGAFAGGAFRSAPEAFHADLAAMLDRMAGLGDRADHEGLADEACAALAAEWDEVAPVAKDAEALDAPLRRAVRAVLEAFPDGIADQFDIPAQTKEFRDNHATLRALGRDPVDWPTWEKARTLRQTKRGAPTPDGYDDLVGAVMEAAEGLIRHPGPRALALRHLRALITGAQDVRHGYAEAKRRLGVIDYGDMLTAAERALRDPGVLEAVLGSVDCVVVDEFQDTNPVQFALLARLVEGAQRVLLVGDAKQSIMGFQGADARLSSALARKHPKAGATLERNWRSVPAIIAFANDVGAALFEDYAALAPTRDEGPAPTLSVIAPPKGRGARGGDGRPQHHAAAHIAALLSDGAEVTQAPKGHRPVRPSDIAVLCRSHAQVSAYAEALRHLGVLVQVDEGGWHEAPTIAAARAALAFLADPEDSHAGLRLATLGPARRPLEEALRALKDGRLAELPELRPLAEWSEAARGQAVPTVLARVIEMAGLDAWALRLPDPAAHLADLARLRAEATTFAGSLAATRAAAGLYGWDVRAFLAWLAVRADTEGGNGRPDPSSGEARGVEIVTWHAAKGREWPVVLVAGIDAKVGARAGELRAQFSGWEDPATLLERAGLRRIPDVACSEVQDKLLEPHAERARQTERCLAYVAITRARDRLILEWPAWAKTLNGTLAGLLVEEADLAVEGDAIRVGGTRHAACVIRPDEAMPPAFEDDPVRPEPVPYYMPGRLNPRSAGGAALVRRPSDAETGAPLAGTIHIVGPALQTGEGGEARARGTALHLAMRVLLTRPDRADALSNATGLDAGTLAELNAQAKGLRTALAGMGLTDLHAEVPVDVAYPDGTAMRGTIDLLARSKTGAAAVIDLKSPAPDDPLGATGAHSGQLRAYADAVRAIFPDLGDPRCGVLWMGSGALVI